MQYEQFFCSMDETLDVWLPPGFAISNSALKKSNFYWNFIILSFNSKWIWSCVCSIGNMADCKFMEESAFLGLPSHHSICPFQLMSEVKKFWFKANILYDQLLSSVPYATLCPIHNSMFMFFVYQTIHQLLHSKIYFFLQI